MATPRSRSTFVNLTPRRIQLVREGANGRTYSRTIPPSGEEVRIPMEAVERARTAEGHPIHEVRPRPGAVAATALDLRQRLVARGEDTYLIVDGDTLDVVGPALTVAESFRVVAPDLSPESLIQVPHTDLLAVRALRVSLH